MQVNRATGDGSLTLEADFGLGFWIGAVLGSVLGLLLSVLFEAPLEGLKHRLTARIHRRWPSYQTGEDLQSIEMYSILTWSYQRPLDPRNHRAEPDTTAPAAQTQIRW